MYAILAIMKNHIRNWPKGQLISACFSWLRLRTFLAAGVTTFMMLHLGFFKGLRTKTDECMDIDPYSRLGDQGPFLSDLPRKFGAF